MKKLFIFELIMAAHVSFCLFVEFQAIIFPRQLTLEELENLPPKANPHANHNAYFDLFGFFGFCLWLLLKYLFEGFRMNSLLILAAYTLFFFDRAIQFSDKIFCQVATILTIIYIWTLVSFPVNTLPKPTGKYRTSFKTMKMMDTYSTDVSIHYPCGDHKLQDIQIKWLPHKKYSKQLYESILCRSNPIIPEWCFDIALSFLSFIKFDSSPELELLGTEHDVIILSHGLTQHRNSYTNIAQQFASEGYVVISPQHLEMVYPWDAKQTKFLQTGNYPEVIEKFQRIRHEHLNWRVEQITHIIEKLQHNDFQLFQLKPRKISVIGHSFGGGTAIRIGQQFKLNAIICYDPWMLPLNEKELQQKMLSPTFIISQERQLRDDMHPIENLQLFLEHNQQTIRKRVKGMDHAHSVDLIYLMGSEMQLFGQLRNSDKAIEMNNFIIEITRRFMATNTVIDQPMLM